MSVADALVYSAKDGLGNRLRALVGFRVLAELQGTPLLLYWSKEGACDAAFSDLFEPDGWSGIRLIDADEAAAHKASHPEHFHHSSVWFTEVWRQYAQDMCSREAFSKAAVRHLRSLQPRRELQATIDTFAKAHELEQCTGMHIRMTDNVHAYDWWKRNDPDFVPARVSRMEGFQAALMNLAARGERGFVCTDNQDVARDLTRKFPDLILYKKAFDHEGFEHHVRSHYSDPGGFSRLIARIKVKLGPAAPSTWRTTEIADALIEMYLLARCRRVIGTYYSSFSQVSALIGGIPLYRMEGVDPVENPFVSEMLQASHDGGTQ